MSVENLVKVCSEYENPGLFGADESAIEESAVKYLEEKGYKVVPPLVLPTKIESSVDLYYTYRKLVDRYHPEWRNVYIKTEQARKIAKRFVETRMQAEGVSRKRALQLCAEILYAVFKFEDEFKFRTSIQFGMFGQGEFKWVSDKAIQLINARQDKLDEEYSDLMINDMYSRIKPRGWSEKKLDRAIKILEEKDNG